MSATLVEPSAVAESPGELPDAVRQKLGQAAPGELARWAMADIDAAGRFGRAWVALSGGMLVVAAETSPARTIPLDADTALEIVAGTGSSRFRVVRAGRLVEELRYSSREARRFSDLLHAAEARSKGEQHLPSPDRAAAPERNKLCRKCNRLIPDWADTCPRCLHRRRVLWRLWEFAWPYRGRLFVGLGAALALAGLQLVPPKLTQHLINDVLTEGPHQRPGLLWPLIGILAAVTIARLWMGYLRLNRLATLSELMCHDLRTRLFDHMQSLSLAYYAKKPTGNLLSRITNDTDRVWDFIAFGIVEALVAGLMVIAIAVILVLEEPVLAVLTIAPVPLGLVLTWFHVSRMHRILTRLWTRWSRMTSVISDVLPGARVVKAFTQEKRESGRFEQRSLGVADHALIVHNEWTRYWPRLSLLLNMGTLVIWSYAAPRILHKQFDLGTFVMFVGYVWMFYGPIEQLGMMNRMFQRAVTAAHRIFEVLDTPPQIFSHRQAVRPGRLKGAITFENVSFSYDGVKRVLHDVSFHIEPGEVVGLAGPSGGGKTTLVNLICRFYDPVEGRILVDGMDVRDMDLHDLRRQVGLVLQEPYLFHGTIAQNIAYGCPDASCDRIITAARAANAHDFVVGFPDGYDTMVGERGQTVSGGERQRLSIARAIINDPRILVLDEATSSVDSKTEARIQKAIDRLVHGRTTLAIAHRLSTLRRAGRLLILDKGRLVEQGTHEELMAREKGVYAGLHRTQAELHALFAV